MRARFMIENPKEIECTMKITMSTAEWENLRDQLAGKWPSSRLSSAITQILIEARKVYYAEEIDAFDSRKQTAPDAKHYVFREDKIKNLKCIIGASILTPICFIVVCLIIALMNLGFDWISTNCPAVFWTFAIIFVCFIIICIWIPIFDHCVKFWDTRKNNKSMQHH